MKIEMQNGQPIIDARDLGPLLGLAPKIVHQMMRDGQITSRFETGEGEDEGKFRLTFFYNGTRLRLTCSADGNVVKTSRVRSSAP